MSIEQTDTIDAMFLSEDGTYVVLVAVDPLDWHEEVEAHIALLRDKLNYYLDYVVSGRLAREHPQLCDVPVAIWVMHHHAVIPRAENLYFQAKEVLGRQGIALVCERFVPEEDI